jgi:hypothetical protein
MNIFIKVINTILLLLVFSLSLANEDTQVTAEELQYDSDKQESIVLSIDPEEKWQDYLDKYGIQPGQNERNGRTFFIVSYTQEVGPKPGDRSFIDSKNIAYSKAVTFAKAELAKFLGSWMVSGRTLTDTEINEDVPQSYIKAVIEPVSTAQRAHKLTNLALDDQIKRFDPTWDGTNIPKEEKVLKLVEHNQRYTEKMSQRARAYLQGASTIFTAEGYSDGDYSVTVGIVWSFKSAKVAEAIYNPTVPLPKGKKNPLSIKDRINKLPDDKLAATMGTRIWWDENGVPVVVSFAATDATGLKSIQKNKTSLQARTQIAQFVSEIVKSDAESNIDATIQAYDDDSLADFNNNTFEEKITSFSKGLPLSGVGSVHYRKFNHPITGNKMVVNVMSWSPDSAVLAKALKQMSKDQETEFDATKGGTVFVNSTDQSLPTTAAGIATPGLEGVSSDPDDF